MPTQNFSSRKARFTSLWLAVALALCTLSTAAHAVSSSELYMPTAYSYGRFEARVQFAFGDGVVSSFFLWKEGSERDNTFWNELDFEKLWADCRLETNALYGDPEMSHNASFESAKDLCGAYHTYTYEWTPDYIAWFVDGEEIRREDGAAAQAFRDNATAGMRMHFNVWPGDESFGGNFDPAILPVRQYINWVQYSSYNNGAFELEWREDFASGGLPAGWATANWPSPKNLSNHAPANVAFINGYAVLSVTADNATGSATEAPPEDNGIEQPPVLGTGGGNGLGGAGGGSNAGAAGTPTLPSEGGAPGQGGTAGTPNGAAGAVNPGGQPGTGGSGGIGNAGGAGGVDLAPMPTDSTTSSPPGPTTAPNPTAPPASTTAPSQASPQVPSSGPSGESPQPTGSAPVEPTEPIDSAAQSDDGCACRITSGGSARSGAERGAWLVALGGLIYWRRRRGRGLHPSPRHPAV
jgi:endo-1,3-1,4-beta-glycanase ExoK